jgi:hypothetical protein
MPGLWRTMTAAGVTPAGIRGLAGPHCPRHPQKSLDTPVILEKTSSLAKCYKRTRRWLDQQAHPWPCGTVFSGTGSPSAHRAGQATMVSIGRRSPRRIDPSQTSSDEFLTWTGLLALDGARGFPLLLKFAQADPRRPLRAAAARLWTEHPLLGYGMHNDRELYRDRIQSLTLPACAI